MASHLTLGSATGPADFAYTPSPVQSMGDLTLVVMGTTDATAGVNSTYSGTMNVTAVPEPETIRADACRSGRHRLHGSSPPQRLKVVALLNAAQHAEAT